LKNFDLFIYYQIRPQQTANLLRLKWEEVNADSQDIIIKQENNFVIKTKNAYKATESTASPTERFNFV